MRAQQALRLAPGQQARAVKPYTPADPLTTDHSYPKVYITYILGHGGPRPRSCTPGTCSCPQVCTLGSGPQLAQLWVHRRAKGALYEALRLAGSAAAPRSAGRVLGHDWSLYEGRPFGSAQAMHARQALQLPPGLQAGTWAAAGAFMKGARH